MNEETSIQELGATVQEQMHDENTQEQTQTHQEDSVQERNFRAMREANDRLQREKEEIERSYNELKSKQSERDPDDLVEARYVNEKIKRVEQQIEQYAIEAKLKAEMPDIESVLSKENVEKLKQRDPELAKVLAASTDQYSVAKTAYRNIMALGIMKEKEYEPTKQKAAQNSSKPRPSVSVNPQHGTSPLSQADLYAQGLTPELKAELARQNAINRRKI